MVVQYEWGESVKNLLCVKSIMTIMLTAMLCIMVYLHPDTYEEVFKNCCIMIVTWYFSYQSKKVNNNDVSSNRDIRGISDTVDERGMKEDK